MSELLLKKDRICVGTLILRDKDKLKEKRYEKIKRNRKTERHFTLECNHAQNYQLLTEKTYYLDKQLVNKGTRW